MSNETPSTVAASTQIPTPGRVLLCFRNKGWTRNKNHDPRPGICVSNFPGSNHNVNVFLDGGNDADVLAEFRASPAGNTLMSAPVYDSLTPEQRAQIAAKHSYWCEWPPLPKMPAKPASVAPAGFQALADAIALIASAHTEGKLKSEIDRLLALAKS